MDPQAGASFIPKKPLVETRSGGGGIFFSLALLMFIASIAAAGAVFGYQGYLKTTIASKDESLKRTEGAFDADAIETLVRTDRRIEEVQGLLSKHNAPSAIFALLGELTLTSVRYDTFNFTLDEGGAASIKLTGIADSFSSVALQSDQFGASKHLSDVVFSDITINAIGRVTFTIDATVSAATISYARQLREPLVLPQSSSEAPLPTTPQATSTSPNATTTTP